MHRWKALCGVCLVISVMISGETLAAGQATPCPGAPTIEERYTYVPDEPFLLIGTGNASTTLDVQQLEDDSLGFMVQYGGNERFEALLTDPAGERRSIFAAIRPSQTSSVHPLRQVGKYELTVEAEGSWSLYVH